MRWWRGSRCAMDRLAIANMRPKDARRHLKEIRGDQSATRENFERAVDNLRFGVLDAHSDAAQKAALGLAIKKLNALSSEVADIHECVADLEDIIEAAAIDAAAMPAAGHA
jgi:hypothetical protein